MRELTATDRTKIATRLREVTPKGATAWMEGTLKNAHFIMDGSSCQSEVQVFVINYLAPPRNFIPLLYRGIAVQPHPKFLDLEDEQRQGLFREADLALIDLSSPVTESMRAIQLPTAEVREDQGIIMVGYGLGEAGYPETKFGFRHFGESQITKIARLASGSTRFSTARQAPRGRESSRSYEGDSGGGGFSAVDDTVLVGIMSARSDGQGAIFESVYPHIQWLTDRRR